MQAKQLKIGDQFTHHEHGQASVIQYGQRALLCKSEKNASFLVDEDYFVTNPIFAKPNVDEIAEIIRGYNFEDVEKLILEIYSIKYFDNLPPFLLEVRQIPEEK